MVAHPRYSVFLPRPDAEIVLYCLPCAGGDAAMFRSWAALLPPTIELRAVRLPGRHARGRDGAVPDFDAAATGIADAIGSELRKPYVLFGHSMGALIGYRLMRVLARRGLMTPTLFVVASSLVQGIPQDRLPDPALSDDAFVTALAELDGAAPEVLADPEVLTFALPALRADYAMCRVYSYRADEPPLDVPVLVLAGTEDTITPVERMPRWQEITRRFRGIERFPGDHFFFRDDAGPLVDTIVAHAQHPANLRRDKSNDVSSDSPLNHDNIANIGEAFPNNSFH
jgi:surfactin synthase thioesterase subunit